MADRTLPDRVGPKAWRKGSAWRWPARAVAGLTAFTFTFLQFTAPFASADQQPTLPDWLKEENGGWVSAQQADRMQKADQDLLTHLSALEQAQQRFVTTHPSGLEVQYAGQEAVVARDSAGNLLWAPTLDDYRKVQNGTLLLVDGTLQVVKNGQLTRQVDAMGNEAVFRADGRVDHETAADGTRTDYAYSETGFTRTTHNPNGDLAQEYNTEGRLVRETTPEGTVSTYSNGILSTVSTGGFSYTYSSETAADGTITATLSEARGADGAVYTLANGELATIRWADGTLATGVQLNAQGNLIAGNVLLPNGTRQIIAAGTVRDVLLTDGRAFHYDAGWLRQLQTGSVVSAYSYTFDAGGNLSSITVTAADGSARVYTAAGTLQGLTDANGTRWTVVGGLLTQSTAPNGTITTYTRINTPTGQQIVRQTGGVTDRFSFDPSGVLYAAGSDRNLAGSTPFVTPLQSFNAGTLSNAGIVATDGKYLYVKPFSSSSKVFTKIGTGFGGTIAGKAYGTFTGSFSGTISATIGPDGSLYQPDPGNAMRLERIDTATGAKSFLTVPAGLLRLDTAKAEKGQVLITSDGRYIYNLSYHQTRNSTTLNGWTVRVFDPKNNWALVKQFTAGTTSFKANGLMSDGTFLYALEWTGTNSARVAVIRITDGAVVRTWTANQGTTKVTNGQYDWVNQRFWLGARSTGKVYAYDDPNDLPLSTWSDREGLRTPIAQTQLPDMNRLAQPANTYATDLQARIARDLPGVRLTYPGLPTGPKVNRPDGLWNQTSWAITSDTLPPSGGMELPALTNQREITLTLSALDPSAVDGTTGSGVFMMRFSLDQGAVWSAPEPFAAGKIVTLPEQNGDYVIQAQFQDVAGNWSEPFARTVTLRQGGGSTLPPVLSLLSAETTNSELYDFLFAADGVAQTSQRWRIGRGQHLLIASAANPSGMAWVGYAILRSGEPFPEPTDPPSLPEGAQVTQTLVDGSVALFIEGTLVSVTTPDGTRLLHPALDDTGRITGGWLTTPDGTTTFLQGGTAVWSKDSFGSVTWYFPDGRPEAVRGKDGTMTAFAYRLDDAGQVVAALITTGNTSTLVDAADKPMMQLRADGSRLSYTQGRLSAIESMSQPAIRYTESVQTDGSIVSERSGSAATDLPRRWVYEANGSLREVTQTDGTVIRFSGGIPTEAVAPDGTVTSFSVTQADSVLKSISVTRGGIVRNYDSTGGIRKLTLPDQAALELQGETAQGLRLADGTRISDGVYDADSKLISGIVTLMDGRVVRYAGGQPVEAALPDGSQVTYSSGAPAGLTLPNGSTYTLTHETNRWVATLTPPSEGTPASDQLTRMVYSEEWALQQATRSDGAQMAYADGLLSTLTQANGTVISYAYDAAGRLASTVAASPDPAEPVIRTEYAYDRIRKAYKGNTLIYEYSYEFDADGNETTTLRDLQANRVKRYRDGLLISQTDPDGAVTTYEYTANLAGYQDLMENALEARQMLPDGTFAYYHRASPASPWEMAGTNPEAELPTDRLSLFRLQRQGRLEAVGVPAAAAGAGSPKVAAATVLYQGRQRAAYTYRYEGTLTRVTDQEGVTRVYNESNRLVAIEQIEGPSYSVSVARDLSAEQMTRLAEMDPSSPEALAILANPAGEEISVHRLTRLTLADGTVVTENFEPDTLVGQEFDSLGRLLTRSQANGQITLYENGRPTQTLDTEGNVTTRFTYNEAGQLVKLTLYGARRELAEGTASARAEVIRKRVDALEELALRKQLAIGQLADQTAQARTQLQNQLTDLGQKLSDLENTDVHGREAKKQKGRALDQIRAGMNQVRSALSSLDQQYSQALGGMESQVESVRNQLESQSASAFASITAKEEEFTRAIIRQEITIILTRVYRNVIGRDPDEKETTQAVDQLYAQFGANPDAALDLTALEQKIRALPDYPVRVQQVAQIRQLVSDRLAAWETTSEEQKILQLAPYGVTLSQIVPLNSESIAEIRTWLNTNSLHFGHSAFLALQGLLAQAEGIQVDAVTLAVEAIWLDILTGVISPRTTGDLELSLFSMEHVSEKYGLSVTPARVSLDDLKAMLPREITFFQTVSPDGRTSYELKEDGTLEIVDLSSDQVTRTVSLFSGLTATEPSITFTQQTDGSLLLQTQGLPVGGIVSFWTENDQAGEAGVYYIKPLDADKSYFTLPAEGVARIPALSYRPGHARVLVFKDAQAIATFQQRQREMHFWSPLYATNFFKDILVTRPGVSYKISDLDLMKVDSSFMSSTGLMVFDLSSGGNLTEMGGFWNPPPDPVFTPQQMLLTPDGNTLWVRASGKTRTGAAFLSLDLRTGVVSQLDTGLITPAQMALSLDGTILYVQDAASPEGGLSSLVAMNAVTGQVLKRAPLPVGALAGMAVAANNQILLAGKGAKQILWLDAGTLQTVRSASVYGSIESLALRPDGQVVYVFDSVYQRLNVFSAITGELLAWVQTDGTSGEVAFSPDGTVVYFTRHDTGTVLRLDAASHQPIQDIREGEGGSDQTFRRRTAPILAHVNGNHYLHVLAVTADGKILVREPNKGPNGSIVSLSAEEFSRIWQGVILSPRAPPHAYQRLTDSETLSITGSFFPLLIPIFIAIATAIGTAVTAIVSAVAALLVALGTLLTSVFTALGTAFSSIGTFFGGFGSLFSGAGLIGQGFSALFAGQILGGLSLIGQGLLGAFGLSSFSWATLGQFALTTAVNVGVSRGLEALGVSPTIASLAGAFTSGGISGALNPVSTTSSFLTKFVAGALTSTAVAGTQIGLVKAGLDPALANIAGIGVGTITNSLALNGLNGLGQTLSTQLAPTLAGELAFYGIQKLGETIGLDSRISQIAGMTLSSGIRSIANGANAARSVFQGMQDGLVRGALSVGVQFATEGLDPLAGSLASSVITGALDGLFSPNVERDPQTGEPIIDPATGKPKYRDSNGDGMIDQRDAKGIFAGIGESFLGAVGGFAEIGILKSGDPVGNAQRLAQLNDFSSVIRDQGLGAALEIYATSLLHRSSIESILNVGTSIRHYGTIQESIEVALTPPDPQDTRPRLHVEEVEFEGRRVLQILFADGGYILTEKDTHNLIAIQEGNQLIRLNGSPKVDSSTQTAAITEATIERTYRDLTGTEVTARVLQEISAGGVTSVMIEGKDGTRYTVTPNSFQHVRLNADGTIKDGIMTEVQTGNTLYFLNGTLVASHAKPFANVQIPNDLQVEISQAEMDVIQTPDGGLDVKIKTPEVTATPPDITEPQKTVEDDLRADLAQRIGDTEAQILWNKIRALVPESQAMPNVAVVVKPAEVVTTGGAFGSTAVSYEKGSFYKGAVPRDSIAVIKVDLTTGTVSLSGGGKTAIDHGQGTAGAYWSTSSTGEIFPSAIGAGVVSSSQMTDSLMVQNAYGLKATGTSLSKVVGEYKRTVIFGNSIETITVTKEPNPWVKAGIQTTELFLAAWGAWGLTKAGAWGVGKAADEIAEVAPSLLAYFKKAFVVGA